jgi:hypothetical protein
MKHGEQWCFFKYEHFLIYRMLVMDTGHTVKPVYKGHLRESENVAFINSCPLYTG